VKRSGCGALGIAGGLVLALALATGAVSRRQLSAVQSPPAPAPETDAFRRQVGALRQFHRDDAGERLRLSYGFVDYSGRPRHVSCEIDKRDYERDLASFGYFEDELRKAVGEGLRERFEREAERRGLRPYLHFELEGGTGYRWRWRIPEGMEAAAAERLEARLRDFDAWLDQRLARQKEELVAQYLRQRGFLLKDGEISIDYEREVERDTGPLADCFAALRRAGEGGSDRRLLGLFLAFVQELRYEVPPDVDLGRHILGFRVPTAVLVRGGGDCDSKSATFCALWRHLPQRAILILVPGHALVGVEGKPRADEAFVRLGNRYFVLCEVAGPGKIPPGGESISGDFEYVMIEPAVG
jgi:hypothetical protein